MDCKTFARHYQSYIDGELDEEMVKKLQTHLEECPRCKKMLIIEQRFKAVIVKKIQIAQAPRELHIRITTELF
ncbi:MAG: zf-HC2 domain-containing protein [bacterium]